MTSRFWISAEYYMTAERNCLLTKKKNQISLAAKNSPRNGFNCAPCFATDYSSR